MKTAKIRTEALCRKGFSEVYSAKISARVYYLHWFGIFLKIQEEFSSICSDCIFWRIIVQSEQKGYKKKSFLRYSLIGISDIRLQKRCFLVSQINTSEKVLIYGISKVYLKRRFEQTCWRKMDFWKMTQLFFALVVYGILSDLLRRIFSLLLSLIWKIERGTIREEKT